MQKRGVVKGGTPSVAAYAAPAPSRREPLAWRQSFRACQRPHPRGRLPPAGGRLQQYRELCSSPGNGLVLSVTFGDSSFPFLSRKRHLPPAGGRLQQYRELCSSPGNGLVLSVTFGDSSFPFLSRKRHLPPVGGSLSKGEALAKPSTLCFYQEVYRHAKGSPFGRAVKADRH